MSTLLGLTAAAANTFGGALIVQKHWERRYLGYFIAVGSGFMLATAFLEMIPKSFDLASATAVPTERTALYILAGYLLVHFFEHTVTPHFHFGEEVHEHEFVQVHKSFSVLLGLMIHSLFDGVAIASGFLVSQWLGWVVFLAVFLHKVPEGFTMSSVMLASGRSRGIAWGASVMLGGATIVGVLLMSVAPGLLAVGLPLSAGVTIYVAASDLLPEVNREPGVKMALLVFLGAGMLLAIDFLVPH